MTICLLMCMHVQCLNIIWPDTSTQIIRIYIPCMWSIFASLQFNTVILLLEFLLSTFQAILHCARDNIALYYLWLHVHHWNQPGRLLDSCSMRARGLPLTDFDMIQNLLDSWLDSKIPNFILEIPVHQIRITCHVISNIRKVTTNIDSEILKLTGNLAICISWDSYRFQDS